MDKNKKHIAMIGGAGAIAGALIHKEVKTVKADQTDGTGRIALVTGASSGIGREIARIFAIHHFDLIIVARNAEKLGELKMEFENSYGVSVMTVKKDLSDANAAQEIYDELKQQDIVVDQLVNNAGAGLQSSVTDADPEAMKRLIDLNVTTPTMMCRLFGHDMVERDEGRILNVSSMGAFIPDPYFNVYGPAKAYELFLTETLSGELDGTNVTVSALCPGPTKTNWAANAGKADAKIAKSPESIAEAGFIGMQKGELIIIPNADYKAVRYIMRPLPAKMQAKIIAKWQETLIDDNE